MAEIIWVDFRMVRHVGRPDANLAARLRVEAYREQDEPLLVEVVRLREPFVERTEVNVGYTTVCVGVN